ncbi:hypothetical protein BTA51_03670 [Hahella sp. CCB-MM4]|uniref:M90 family metallopeptidase n=1 Tax=Hahella sp. (strain CCB-MM4) TaxID=1926491 RepID=UPI000B9ABDDA|nr:M90 family metallopeptidase [Hahella sp. CCB-MM4]OZG74749.1 hypothetical protein BTA51_03670 [Hahella sp. CCB-MM4]
MSIWKWLEHQRIRYTLSHHPIPHETWHGLMHKADVFRGLTAVERAHLRELSTLFLQRKSFSGVQGLTVSMDMAVAVAAQACLLILKLGLDYYDGWVEIVIYPEAFKVPREVAGNDGLVTHQEHILSGESWSRGPVILSWDTAVEDISGHCSGHNVVIHEFAHKLDMLNGSANGMPPLHSDMVRQQWTTAFSEAFEQLQQQLTHHQHPHINAYAATSPAEFFAVCSEYFFTSPRILHRQFPAVYDQLRMFYRQDPGERLVEDPT